MWLVLERRAHVAFCFYAFLTRAPSLEGREERRLRTALRGQERILIQRSDGQSDEGANAIVKLTLMGANQQTDVTRIAGARYGRKKFPVGPDSTFFVT